MSIFYNRRQAVLEGYPILRELVGETKKKVGESSVFNPYWVKDDQGKLEVLNELYHSVLDRRQAVQFIKDLDVLIQDLIVRSDGAITEENFLDHFRISQVIKTEDEIKFSTPRLSTAVIESQYSVRSITLDPISDKKLQPIEIATYVKEQRAISGALPHDELNIRPKYTIEYLLSAQPYKIAGATSKRQEELKK